MQICWPSRQPKLDIHCMSPICATLIPSNFRVPMGSGFQTWPSSTRYGGSNNVPLLRLAVNGWAAFTQLAWNWIGQSPATSSARPRLWKGNFVYLATPSFLKWTARARTGALSTGARLLKNTLAANANCRYCSLSLEDGAHVLVGCPVTGSMDCADYIIRLWLQVCGNPGVQSQPLSSAWLQANLLQLVVALSLVVQWNILLLQSHRGWRVLFFAIFTMAWCLALLRF